MCGLSVQDLIGEGYTILKLGRTRADASSLIHAFKMLNAPVSVLDIPDRIAR